MRPRIAILSLSRIIDDPRVRRQGDAFLEAGWDVIGIGLVGGRSEPPRWPCSLVDIGDELYPRGGIARIARALSLFIARTSREAALRSYWSRPAIGALYKVAQEHSADVWLANDWNALPIAATLAARDKAVLGYDTHELAIEEFSENRRWRLLHRPIVLEVERRHLPSAAVVTTVSDGIADVLQMHYGMSVRPSVVRNVPSYRQATFRKTKSSLRVLYQGLLSQDRGIDAVVSSVANWRPNISLYLRGPVSESYLALLRKHILKLGLGGRVKLLPPIAMTDLVQATSDFDVGIVSLPGWSDNNRHALPNKLFEYIMGGLAVCVSNLPAMRALVSHFNIGVSFNEAPPGDLTAVINSLTPEIVDEYKCNALNAAKILCWEEESRHFISIYNSALLRHSMSID